MLSVFDEGAFAPCPAPFNMARHVLSAGEKNPQKIALMILSKRNVECWNYGELRSAILGTATGFLQTGLKPDDVILMRLGNTVDFPIAYLGALAAGMVPVPTSAALTETETEFVIDTVTPAAILLSPEVACPRSDRFVRQDRLRQFRSLPPAQFHEGDPERLGYIVFTSGTAGTPRAVAHAHRAIWARQMMFEDWYGLNDQDSLLHAGAFNWTYTLGTGLMDPWTVGATALIPVPGTAPEDIPNLLKEHKATIFAAAPGVYRQLLDRSGSLDLPDLRHGLSAGEKLPQSISDRWQQATGKPILEAYGMSECSTFISQAPSDEAAPGTLGRPQKGRNVALLDNGKPVPIGREGTIAINRNDPGLTLGYLNAREATAHRMVGGWFVTGDQAVMDANGHITYMGRNDDMMNAGGYRVSPIEVENVLAEHPKITSVAVTTVEVKKDTEVVAAFYTGPDVLDEDDLRAYVSKRLARYKQPRIFTHLPKLPKGANGKILRRALRTRIERPK